MTHLRTLSPLLTLGIILFGCTVHAAAQQAAMATNPSGKPFFQSVKLNNGQAQKMDFSVREVGSVTGRVFTDAETAAGSQETDQQGIGGVKVTLRSGDKGFETFALEQFTDDTGSYKFQDLRPGKYSIVIDPANLPANFRAASATDAPIDVQPSKTSNVDLQVAANRAISGVVFVDKDGDGRYTRGKDFPVEGAYIVIDDLFITSDSNGAYAFHDLPAGRMGLLVSWPKRSENTHVRLDLGEGPVTNRVVNIPMIP